MPRGSLVAGSVAERAIKFLASLPAGASASSVVIAEAIDYDATLLAAVLKPHAESGRVVRAKDGRMIRWSVGTGTPASAQKADDEDDASERSTQTIVRAGAAPRPPTTGAPSVFALGEAWQPPAVQSKGCAVAVRQETSSPVAAPRRNRPPPANGHASTLGVGIFNTGSLVIEAPGQPPLRLTRSQALELVSFLDRIVNSLEKSA